MGCEGETRKKNLEVWRKMRRERRHRGRRGEGVAVGSTSRNSFRVDGISDPLDTHASWSGLTRNSWLTHTEKIASA